MIKLLNGEQIKENFITLGELLKYCYQTASNINLPNSFYENKLNGLISYVNDGKAFFFTVWEKNKIVGFLWAYEIEHDAERVMHIAYLVVSKEFGNKGYGNMLMNAVTDKALTMGIKKLELNVRAANAKAIDFYKKHNFYDEHITLIKEL